jgi:hypothetical protein
MFQLNNDSSDNLRARCVVRRSPCCYARDKNCLCVTLAPPHLQVLALRALNRLFLFVSTKRVVAAVSNGTSNTFLSRSPPIKPHTAKHLTPNDICSIVSALTARSLDAITAAGPLLVTCIRRLPSLIPLQVMGDVCRVTDVVM